MIVSEMTVREVALQLPQSTRLFEKLKIDYCCGGNRPLTEACTGAGLNVDDLVGMLNVATQPDAINKSDVDFPNLSLSALIDHVVETHHVFTKSEMDRLEALTEKVVGAHGGNHQIYANMPLTTRF